MSIAELQIRHERAGTDLIQAMITLSAAGSVLVGNDLITFLQLKDVIFLDEGAQVDYDFLEDLARYVPALQVACLDLAVAAMAYDEVRRDVLAEVAA